MNVTQIIAAETMGHRATRAVRTFVSGGQDRDELNRVDYLLSEVRQYAVMWDQIRTLEDTKEVTPEKAKEMRQQAIVRLTSACAPGRL